MSRVPSMRQKVEVEVGLLDDLLEILNEYFIDSDFDRDGHLSETHAELSVFLHDHKGKQT